jgi:hypothetical protein
VNFICVRAVLELNVWGRRSEGTFYFSDFPTAFLGPNIGPSPNVINFVLFPISWGKFPIAGDKIIHKNR